MAAGDGVTSLQNVANNAFLDIQPGAGVEWQIHNIFHEAAIQVQWYDGSSELPFLDVAGKSFVPVSIIVQNSRRLRVKNVSGATQNIGYSGVVWKE